MKKDFTYFHLANPQNHKNKQSDKLNVTANLKEGIVLRYQYNKRKVPFYSHKMLELIPKWMKSTLFNIN